MAETPNIPRYLTVKIALKSLGGQAEPAEIAEEIRRLFPESQSKTNLTQSVRARLQECSSDSISYKGKRDLFYSVYGIGNRVWGLREHDALNPNCEDGFSDPAEPYMATEGTKKLKTHLRRERSKALIKRFKAQLDSFSCVVCGFEFEKTYGELGVNFIEAHHKIPVSSLEPGAQTSLNDLVAVCSNCHRMLHVDGNKSIDELKSALKHCKDK